METNQNVTTQKNENKPEVAAAKPKKRDSRFDLLPANALLKIISSQNNCGAKDITDNESSILNILNYTLGHLLKYLDGDSTSPFMIEIGRGLVLATGLADGSIENYRANDVSGYITYGVSKVAECFADDAIENGERAWENGVPMHKIVDDIMSNILKAIASINNCHASMETTAEYIRRAAWKALEAIWMENYRSEQQDIPMRKANAVS